MTLNKEPIALSEGTESVGEVVLPVVSQATGSTTKGLLATIVRSVMRRAIQLVISVIGLSIVLFTLLHASGDPAYTIAGADASAETIEAIREDLGLNQPLVVQYGQYFMNMVTLNFGESTSTRTSASAMVWAHLPNTLLLGLFGMTVALLVAVPLGTWLAMRSRTILGRIVHLLIKAGQAVPGFVVGLFLVLIFAVQLRLFPVAGSDSAVSMVLPTFALASYLIPKLTRMTRSAALEALAQEHVVVARAKGLSDLKIAMQYVARNCLVTLTALLSLQIAHLVSGAVVIESLFAWPGVGRLMVSSVLASDFSVVQASVVYIAIVISVINAVLDSIVPLLDPRVRGVR